MSCQRILWEELRSFTALEDDLPGAFSDVAAVGFVLAESFQRHSQLLPSYRHAAGIIDFVDLKSQTAERMGKVFKPKAGRDVFMKGGIRTEIKITI